VVLRGVKKRNKTRGTGIAFLGSKQTQRQAKRPQLAARGVTLRDQKYCIGQVNRGKIKSERLKDKGPARILEERKKMRSRRKKAREPGPVSALQCHPTTTIPCHYAIKIKTNEVREKKPSARGSLKAALRRNVHKKGRGASNKIPKECAKGPPEGGQLNHVVGPLVKGGACAWTTARPQKNSINKKKAHTKKREGEFESRKSFTPKNPFGEQTGPYEMFKRRRTINSKMRKLCRDLGGL